MKYNVIAIPTHLQKVSLGANILKKCQQLNLPTLHIQIITIENVPLFNVDLFQEKFPDAIHQIRQKVLKADAIIFTINQLFGKVSPAFKNIYDWLSYSPNQLNPSPIRNIPASIITIGQGDGSAIQRHFLQISQFCRLRVATKPSLHLCTINKQIYGQNLNIFNEKWVFQLQNYLQQFSQFVGKKRKNQ